MLLVTKRAVFLTLKLVWYDRSWMRCNFLALNDSRSKVVHFTSRFHKPNNHRGDVNIQIGDLNIGPTPVVRNLGVLFDNHATLSNHIANICKNASYSLWRIGKIRPLLDTKRTEKLIHAFITCRLDYCNSLLLGAHDYQLRKLQVINAWIKFSVLALSSKCLIFPIRQRE